MEEIEEEKYPCDDCTSYCDGWDAMYCCSLCRWKFGEDTPCDNCDPMDI